VLTAPRSQAFSRQMALPFAPIVQVPTKGMRGTGSAGPLHEPAARTLPALAGDDRAAGPDHRAALPPRGVATERSDKPGGP